MMMERDVTQGEEHTIQYPGDTELYTLKLHNLTKQYNTNKCNKINV